MNKRQKPNGQYPPAWGDELMRALPIDLRKQLRPRREHTASRMDPTPGALAQSHPIGATEPTDAPTTPIAPAGAVLAAAGPLAPGLGLTDANRHETEEKPACCSGRVDAAIARALASLQHAAPPRSALPYVCGWLQGAGIITAETAGRLIAACETAS